MGLVKFRTLKEKMGELKTGGMGPEEISLPETKEEPAKKIVWMVEDNADYAQAVLSSATIFGKTLNLVHYQTGEETIRIFQSILEHHGRLPNLILMDYQLDQGVENPKYRTGVEVIRDLQKLAQEGEIKMPEIIGISGDKGFSEKLLAAGAIRTEDKLQMFKLLKELAEQN